MADTKISALPAATVAAVANELAANEAGASKKVTLQQVMNLLGVSKAQLAADHVSLIVLGTACAMNVALAIGTHVFTYYILAQSATSTVGPTFGVNFTGTAAVRKMVLRYAGTGTAASTGVADDVVAAPLATGNVYEGQIVEAFTTTAPNMAAIAGVGAVNQNILYIIEGILIATVAGNLELWHGSETATSTTVKAGTSVVAIRTA